MRGRELSLKICRIDFERRFVLFPTLLVLVLRQQVGSEVFADESGIGIDL